MSRIEYIKGVNKGDFLYCKVSYEDSSGHFIEGRYYEVYLVLGGDYSQYCIMLNDKGFTSTFFITTFETHFETKIQKRNRIVKEYE